MHEDPSGQPTRMQVRGFVASEQANPAQPNRGLKEAYSKLERDARHALAQPFSGGATTRLYDVAGHFNLRAQKWNVFANAALAIVVTWLPLAILCALQSAIWGSAGIAAFLSDFSAQARYLVVVPVLHVAELICTPRIGRIALRIGESGLIKDIDRPQFAKILASTGRLQKSRVAEAICILLALSVVVCVAVWPPVSVFAPWEIARPGHLSFAGWWQLLVSAPVLLLLLLGWIWRITLWGRFLYLTSQLDMQLVASHPDGSAGMKFVGQSLASFSLLGFAIGALAAGFVADRVANAGVNLLTFKFLPMYLAFGVLMFFMLPLIPLAHTLLKCRQSGLYQYGALTSGVARVFERKWLRRHPIFDDHVLGASDFSALTDLYSITDRVYRLRILPVNAMSVTVLVGATLLPFTPVILMTISLEKLLSKLAGLFF